MENGRARFFNRPLEIFGLTLTKIEREKARGIVVVPFWTQKSSILRLRRLADALTTLLLRPGSLLVVGAQKEKATCPLLLAKFRLVDVPNAKSAGATVVVAKTVRF